jgi:hypothetical protein
MLSGRIASISVVFRFRASSAEYDDSSGSISSRSSRSGRFSSTFMPRLELSIPRPAKMKPDLATYMFWVSATLAPDGRLAGEHSVGKSRRMSALLSISRLNVLRCVSACVAEAANAAANLTCP